jgi:predicted dehydrogenase
MHKVLIIGCGNIAGGFDADRDEIDPPFTHAGAYRRHGSFEVTACVDPDTARREAFMRRWSVARGFSTLDEALNAGPGFDIVSICSPTAAHYADILAALQAKPRLIFCEKPVTDSAQKTREVVERCAAAGVLLAVNYTRRWDAELANFAAELKRGTWGRLRAVSCTYNKGVLNNGSHMIDALHMLLGELTLQHVAPPVYDMLPTDPSVPAVLQSEDGVCIQLNCANAGDYSLFEFEFVTEKGVITIEDGGINWRVREARESENFKGYRALDAGTRKPGRLAQATLAAVTEIYCVLQQGGALASTGANAIAAQVLCERMHEQAIQQYTRS